MFLDKSLTIALLISIIFHAAMFLPLPQLKNLSVKKAPLPLKITYLAPKEIPPRKTRPKEKKPIRVVKDKANEKNVLAKFRADDSSKAKDMPVKKKVDISKAAKQHLKVKIPPELPKEKEALYLDYYQLIREKIKRYVVNNYPQYVACGEIRLYFVLLSNGKLKEINIIEEQSSQNRLLKEIAKKSVQEASPFLSFPKDLNQPQLSFNVMISFELED